ncbi:hypothetical protein A3754_12465 [Alcanivorax sp. HI0083]|nr:MULTISPECIES: hypothetical protein [unclassified Alcanivorax]KZY39575.1 hypothetical protein A3730_01065 [Alcanivorax sp. HI0044]KZZ26089.1 hypothetical protein A3754_12465 [Alcanivorax sp. HI0083]
MAEWAPQYSKGERIVRLLCHAGWAAPLFLLTEFFFFPWFERYMETAHCHHYGSLNGLELVIYSLFIGLPLGLALVVLAIEGRHSLQILRLGQSPLPGEKVFRPTRYVYGNRARIKPVIFFLLVVFLCGVSVQGFVWASATIGELSPDVSRCLIVPVAQRYMFP